jgi:hypothetical protein
MKRFRDLLQKARQNLKTSEHNISLSTTEKNIEKAHVRPNLALCSSSCTKQLV